MKQLFLGLLFITLIPLACKQVPRTNTQVPQQSTVHGVVLSNNYDTYLNQIIALQQKFPITKPNVLRFPVKVHVVNPLMGTELKEEDFSEALSYLNSQFIASNIQFDFVKEGNGYIYSERNVDHFYQNAIVEKFYTEKTYDENVINLYIFDDYEDVIGYTHYPVLNINRIFIAKKHLTDPAFIHEMGHFFGLLHTFEKQITQQSNIDNKKCTKNGDKICDTPPDPFGASFIESDCKLFGDYKDGNGKNFRPDMNNFMSYYGSCRTQFSPQQQHLMYFIAKMIKHPKMRVRA
jgi:hypothetical protein